LVEIAKLMHKKIYKTKADRNDRLQIEIQKLSDDMSERTKSFSLPINPKIQIKCFVPSKCRCFSSKKRPLFLVFKNADELGDDI